MVAFLVAFLVGAGLTLAELGTTTYPNLLFLVKRAWEFWAYGAIYGIIAGFVAAFLPTLQQDHIISLSGVAAEPVVQALAVGASLKALLHIRLFSVSVNGQSFPVGIETLVQIFEPWLLDHINYCSFSELTAYLEPFASRHTDLKKVKESAKEHIPPLTDARRKAFESDIDRQVKPREVMRLFLASFGKRLFEQAFA